MPIVNRNLSRSLRIRSVPLTSSTTINAPNAFTVFSTGDFSARLIDFQLVITVSTGTTGTKDFTVGNATADLNGSNSASFGTFTDVIPILSPVGTLIKVKIDKIVPPNRIVTLNGLGSGLTGSFNLVVNYELLDKIPD